jgi:hypothetical protein
MIAVSSPSVKCPSVSPITSGERQAARALLRRWLASRFAALQTPPPVDGRASAELWGAATTAHLDKLMPWKPAKRQERRPDDRKHASRGAVRKVARVVAKLARAKRLHDDDIRELATAVAALQVGKAVR